MDRLLKDHPNVERIHPNIRYNKGNPELQKEEPLPYVSQDKPYTLTYNFTSTPNNPGNGKQHSKKAWETTPDNQKVIEKALADIETYLNIKFVKVDGDDKTASINFSEARYYDRDFGAHGGVGRFKFNEDGTIELYQAGVTFSRGTDLATEKRGYNITIHEIVHALNLTHTYGNDNWSADVLAGKFGKYSNEKYSTMGPGRIDDTGKELDSLGVMGVSALQKIWGPNKNLNSEDTVYDGKSGFVIKTIWDTGGRDRLDASDGTNDVELHLYDGAFSNFGGAHDDVVIALGAVIEDATGGSGKDLITGNDFANQLIGNAGDDTLQGRGGNDTIDGGTGKDTAVYSGNFSDYEIIKVGENNFMLRDIRPNSEEIPNNGLDMVSNVELFEFKDGTKSLAEIASGSTETEPEAPSKPVAQTENPDNSSVDNRLYYEPGKFNILDGDSSNDTADFSRAEFAVYVDLAWRGGSSVTKGTDSVYSSGPWQHVAKLNAFENIAGSKFDDRIVGNGGNNILTGEDGNDTFMFKEDFGHDTITDYVSGEDYVRLQRIASGDGFDDLEISHAGDDTIVGYGDGTITFIGVNSSTLDVDDFVFS